MNLKRAAAFVTTIATPRRQLNILSSFADTPLSTSTSRIINNLIAESSITTKDGPRDGPREVTNCHYVNIPPSPPPPAPYIVSISPSAASLLSLPPPSISLKTYLKTFTGCTGPSIATIYGCHCGTQYFGQLGDGRAVTISELNGQEVQLKGSTTTPFSRGFDGKATLRGSVRELLGCEGLNGLKVPTTRALCVVGTGDYVHRPWYTDGEPSTERKFPPNHMIRERGAVLTRFCPSFLRLGHFEIHALRGETAELLTLIEHGIEVLGLQSTGTLSVDVRNLVEAVARNQAVLMGEWMRVGYCQGNMNSDNTSVLGLTLDLGPFSFMDSYSRGFQPFTSDGGGMFSFCNQPSAALTAIKVWSAAVTSVLEDNDKSKEIVKAAEDTYRETFKGEWEDVRRRKLGFKEFDENVGRVWAEMEELMEATEHGVDYTVFFARLVNVVGDPSSGWDNLRPAFYAVDFADGGGVKEEDAWRGWVKSYVEALEGEDMEERIDVMTNANPLVVPRNWMLYEAYKRAGGGVEGDEEQEFDTIEEMLGVLSNPYQIQRGEVDERYFGRTPKEYVGRPGLAFLS